MRVLIAEDKAAMRKLIKNMVEGWGHTVFECSDGESTIKMYASLTPDCVLMDIEMSPVDGLTATRAIKLFDPDARIIIVTHYNDDEFRDEGRKAGADFFISKENLLELQNIL